MENRRFTGIVDDLTYSKYGHMDKKMRITRGVSFVPQGMVFSQYIFRNPSFQRLAREVLPTMQCVEQVEPAPLPRKPVTYQRIAVPTPLDKTFCYELNCQLRAFCSIISPIKET